MAATWFAPFGIPAVSILNIWSKEDQFHGNSQVAQVVTVEEPRATMLRKIITFLTKTVAQFISASQKRNSIVPSREGHQEKGSGRRETTIAGKNFEVKEVSTPKKKGSNIKRDLNFSEDEAPPLSEKLESSGKASPSKPIQIQQDDIDAVKGMKANVEEDRNVPGQGKTPCDSAVQEHSDLAETTIVPDEPTEKANQDPLRQADSRKENVLPAEIVGDSSASHEVIDQPQGSKRITSDYNDHESKVWTDTSETAKIKTAKPKFPRNISGRRSSRVPRKDPIKRVATIARPELLCRAMPDGTWTMVVVAENEFQIESVVQKGSQLQLTEGTCYVQSFRSQLSVELNDGTSFPITLFEGKPLYFKLPKNWSGDGRIVKGMSNGHYIVFAPSEWTRTGQTPVESDACTDEEFTAHYFYVNEMASVEEIGGFLQFDGKLGVVACELKGKRVFDNSEDGDLFVGEAPRLSRSKDFVWARVGEEPRDSWAGENFEPRERNLASVLCGRQGRFFVRVYDAERMVDSLQFRYFRDLREICIDGEPYSNDTLLVPPATGHSSTEVRFVGAGDATVRPTLRSNAAHARVHGNMLLVDSHPSGDDVFCRLQSETGGVDIALKLPRLWWRLERGSAEHSEWQDKPYAMTREEFLERAHAGWSMRLRSPPQLRSGRFGFGGEGSPAYPLGNSRNPVPLADFVDFQCISEHRYTNALFEAEVAGKRLVLVRVAADPVPKIVSFTSRPKSIDSGESATLRWETKHTEPGGVLIEPNVGEVESDGTWEVMPEKTRSYTLRLTAKGINDITRSITVTIRPPLRSIEVRGAWVKNAQGGWRMGRGFSQLELRDSNLKSDDVLHRGLRTDARRRTAHAINVEFLKGLINA